MWTEPLNSKATENNIIEDTQEMPQFHLIPVLLSKIAGWVANSVEWDQTPQSAASDLGL